MKRIKQIMFIAIRSAKEAILKEDQMIVESMIEEVKHPSVDKVNIYFGRYLKDRNKQYPQTTYRGAAWGIVYRVPVDVKKASYVKSIFEDMGYDVPDTLTQRQYLRRI